MVQYRATAEGNIPMTPEEEAEFEASRAPKQPTNEESNAPIFASLSEIDKKRVRPMTAILLGIEDVYEGKTALERLHDLEMQAVALRSQIVR